MARRAVLFDLYDTLLIAGDRERMRDDWTAAFKATMVAAGLRISEIELKKLSDTLWTYQSLHSRPDGFTIYEGRINDYAISRGFTPRPELVRHTAIMTLNAWQGHWRLDTATHGVLAELQKEGYATGLVTNFDHWPHVRQLLRKLGLEGLFDEVAISGEVGSDKPHPEIFQGILGKLGVAPSDAVHIGDHDDDVHGAAAAGIAAIRIWRLDPAQRRQSAKSGSLLSRLFRRNREPEPTNAQIAALEEAVDAIRNIFAEE